MAQNFELLICPEADPVGTPVATLTEEDFTDLRLDIRHNDLGRNTVKLPRATWDELGLDAGATYYVRVNIPFIEETGTYWGFWLIAGDFVLASEDEEGGEDVTIGGPGPAWILTKARLNWREWTGHAGVGVQDGEWYFIDKNYGQILQILLNEDAASDYPALGDMDTPTWDATNDSDGVSWTEFGGTYRRSVGDDYLTIIRDLQRAGSLDIHVGANLNMQAFVSYGRDLTGSSYGTGVVRFVGSRVSPAENQNIVGELVRSKDSGKRFTHVLVLGNDRRINGNVVEGHPMHQWVVDPDWSPGDAIRQGFVSFDTSRRFVMERVGERYIERSKDRSGRMVKFKIATGQDESQGLYLPGSPVSERGNFWIGDLVTVKTGTAGAGNDFDFNNRDLPIAAIELHVADASSEASDTAKARSMEVWVTTGDDLAPSGSAASVAAGVRRGTTGGICRCLRLCSPTPSEPVAATLEGAGVGGETTGSPLEVPFPATVAAGRLAILHFNAENTGITPSTPAGWTLLVAGNGGSPMNGILYGKITDGTEDGTNVSLSGWGGFAGTAKYGRIYIFNGPTSLDEIGDIAVSGGTSAASATAPTVEGSETSTAFLFIALSSNQSPGDMTGETGGDWTEAVADVSLTTGDLALQSAELTDTEISGGSMAISAGTDFLVFGFAFGIAGEDTVDFDELHGIENDAARCDHLHLIESLLTAETDTGLALVPDGAGGVEWGSVGGGTLETWEDVVADLSGKVHRWKFEESAGTNVNDEIGSLDLALTGSVSLAQASPLGNAVAFTGGYAESTGLGSVPVGDAARTIIIVWKRNAAGATGAVVPLWAYGANTTRALFQLYSTGPANQRLTTSVALDMNAPFADGAWHLSAGSHAGTGSQYGEQYIDGLMFAGVWGGNLATSTANNFHVAAEYDDTDPATITVTDCIVFDRLLAKAELDRLYRALQAAM